MQQLTSHYLVLQPSHFPLACSIAQVTHKETRHGLEGLQGKGRLVLYNHTVPCTANAWSYKLREDKFPVNSSDRRWNRPASEATVSERSTFSLKVFPSSQGQSPSPWRPFFHVFLTQPSLPTCSPPTLSPVTACCKRKRFREKESCFRDSTTIFGVWISNYIRVLVKFHEPCRGPCSSCSYCGFCRRSCKTSAG